MSELRSSLEKVKRYLEGLYGGRVELKGISRMGDLALGGVEDFKGFGYGAPYLIEFEGDGRSHRLVFNTMRGDMFGHEHPWDRAQSLLMAYSTFNRLPRHVKALDVGILMEDGSLKSLRGFREFFLATEFIEGTEYWRDLDRIGRTGELTELDVERCHALSRYLAEIHSEKLNAPQLYRRRIRELIGHGECIMGLIDSYPGDVDLPSQRDLQSIEEKCLKWRWRLKDRCHRLSQVHGDYHPWNILFRDGVDFTVLDRSRGEWGEPADDIAAMTINYIFFSLRYNDGEFTEPFTRLVEAFLDTYIGETDDEEILEVIQPFYAWRALVLASPLWYPDLPEGVRRRLINFIFQVLERPRIEVAEIPYLFQAQ
ncbi:MAG: phosphotransferase [Candidatus Bathyarchaeia archaeon]